MKGLYCPDCKSDKHIFTYEQDGLFVCEKCNKILGYLCRGCDRVYLSNRLTFHQDAYVCKECGSIQWGYTEFKRQVKRCG